jgi:hypothetical protein
MPASSFSTFFNAEPFLNLMLRASAYRPFLRTQGRLPLFSKLFSKVFGQFPKVWKSLEKSENVWKFFSKLYWLGTTILMPL